MVTPAPMLNTKVDPVSSVDSLSDYNGFYFTLTCVNRLNTSGRGVMV